jgi:hypothetical protein
MAVEYYQKEDGSGNYQLEDASGSLLLESSTGPEGPPPNKTRAIITAAILATWALTVATPLFATVGLQNGPVVQPPTRSAVTQSIIRQSWEPQPRVDQPRRFTPQAGEVGKVPFARLPVGILESWQPQQVGPLWRSVGLQDGPVVKPPVYSKTTQSVIRQSWEPIPRAYEPRRVVPQPAVVAQVPFARLPASILESWQPRQVGPLWRTVGLQDGPVVKPPVSRTNTEIALRSWEPLTAPVQPRRFVQPVVVVTDNPPPSSRVNQLISIRTWDPPSSTPLWRGVVLQDGPVVQPPVSRTNTEIILRSWVPELAPSQARRFVQPGVVVADNPPVAHRLWLETVLASWEPKPKQPVWFNRIIDLSVKPIQRWERLYQILETWHPGPSIRQRSRVVTPSGPEYLPTIDHATRLAILATWEPGLVVQPRRTVLIPAGVVETGNTGGLHYITCGIGSIGTTGIPQTLHTIDEGINA